MKSKRRISIITQISVLAIAGLILVGAATFFSQLSVSKKATTDNIKSRAANIAAETAATVMEYPAHDWLIRYWYDHADELDIEYDAGYNAGTATEGKVALLQSRHPELRLEYASEQELEALSEEDQKLYAEITYSWLTTRIDRVKQSHSVDYLFCVITDTEGSNAYKDQFFLFSGAEPGAVRGYNYTEVYPLGKEVSVAENQSQQDAMRTATENRLASTEQYEGYLADAGDYIDYYSFLTMIDDRAVIIGMTYDLSGIMSSIRTQTMEGTGYSMIYLVLLMTFIILNIFLFGIGPLKNITESIRRYTESKDSEKTISELEENLKGITGFAVRRNEIGQLSADVADMTREIDDYIDRIETINAEKKRMEVELDLAARIQLSVLPDIFPPFPERSEFDIFALMDPARSVGGDFYDFFLIDEDHLGIVIADVSGKGIPAALYMMVSKAIMQNNAFLDIPAEDILTKTNGALTANNDLDMFVTSWVGILEISSGKITAANAGHEYPAVKKANGHFELMKDRHGLVLGAMEDSRYKGYEITLEPGDTLFLYTDGVPEAANKESTMFGTDRMIEALNVDPEADPETLIRIVRHSVDLFTGDATQFDDITMVCLRYKGCDKQA